MTVRIINENQEELYFTTDCISFNNTSIEFETEQGTQEIELNQVMEIYE